MIGCLGWVWQPAASLNAQTVTGQITGRVVTGDGNALPDVLIRVGKSNIVGLTNRDGQFHIQNVAPGSVDIALTRIGYEQKIINHIPITADSTYDLGRIVLTARVLFFGETVVSATRSRNPAYSTSSPLNVVSASQLAERAVKTSAEALREETGIFVQKTSHGGGSAIIRGLGSNQILLLVDGIRLNNSTYRLGNHQYLTTVDANMLSQIEVIRGPNSVLYGSDALGGSINLISKKPLFSSDGPKLNYRWLNRYATADEEKTSYGELALMGKRWGFFAGLGYKDYGDLKRGEHSEHAELEKSKHGAVQSPTGFSAYDANVKLMFRATSQQYWTLAYQLSRQNKVPRYDKYENDDYHRWLYHPQKRDLFYLTYENHLQAKWLQNIKATVSWHRQEEGREQQKRFDSEITDENDIVHTAGIGLQFNPLFRNHSLVYGFDVYYDRVASRANTMNPFTRIKQWQTRGRFPDGAVYVTGGVFWQDQWQISPSLRLLLGSRFSYVDTEFRGEPGPVQQQFSAHTTSLGLIYAVTSYFNLTANLGQAFRAPNLSDITKLGESKGRVYEVPNHDLKPEKMLNIDIGLKIYSDRAKMTVSAYYAQIYDLLASADATYHGSTTIQRNGEEYIIKSKQNIGRAYMRGVEFSLDCLMLDNLHLYGNGHSTFGQNTTLNEPIGGIPPTCGLLGLKWMESGFFATAYGRFAARQNRLSADDLDDPRIPEGGTPAWWILNIRAGATVFDSCRLQFGVENIFDLNYREHGSGVNGPGRNFIVSLEIAKSK
ncbi:TonB-dependent receptor [candidate division KSB1 bacterium]|nr:TonB-dependent receptor [candidate division KSB1 bacterium]